MPVNHLLGKFLAGQTFGPIVTRDFKPPKPDPAGILHIAKAWGFEDARDMIMVGYVAVHLIHILVLIRV